MQRQLAAWLAEWIEPIETLANLSALELGAGDGLLTELLAPRIPQLVSTDIADRMVEAGLNRLPHITWRVADSWALQRESVDRLYSASLLHWCQEPAAVLRRWRRFINPGGRMLHGYYVSPTLVNWQLIADGYSPVAWRTASQWQALFRDAGWQIARAETRQHVQHFRSAIEFVRFLHHTGAVSPRHTPVAQLRRMVNDYECRCAAPDGLPGVTSTWTFFRIETIRS